MIKLITVVGATATGKSALAVRLASSLNGEIISGDSAQVYRGMDIGTAKVTKEEMGGVPHHLIDILDIESPFSAGSFAALAGEKAEEIHSRGGVPFIVGGTGLYVDALTGGKAFSETKDSDPAVRAELMRKADSEGAQALHAYLASVDPTAAAEIHPNNVKRVARAIEIYLVTGKTKTELIAQQKSQSRFKRCLILLNAADRQALYERINARVDKMFEQGLEEEAYRLWRDGLESTPTAGQAIGYKELFPYFSGAVSLDTAKENIKQATRNYAKRQVTYFKRMEGAHVLECTEGADIVFEKAYAVCSRFLAEE